MPRFAETLWLRRASQINDRQVLPTAMIAHIKANGGATVASDRCVRRGAGRAARPSRARFVSRPLTRRQHIMIENLMRCLAIERRVRATLIIPNRKTRYLLVERVRAQWHQTDARAFVLEAQDESFNERDTSVLANSTEAGRDPLAITPGLERIAPELLALVADKLFWGGTCVDNGAFEEGLN